MFLDEIKRMEIAKLILTDQARLKQLLHDIDVIRNRMEKYLEQMKESESFSDDDYKEVESIVSSMKSDIKAFIDNM